MKVSLDRVVLSEVAHVVLSLREDESVAEIEAVSELLEEVEEDEVVLLEEGE